MTTVEYHKKNNYCESEFFDGGSYKYCYYKPNTVIENTSTGEVKNVCKRCASKYVKTNDWRIK